MLLVFYMFTLVLSENEKYDDGHKGQVVGVIDVTLTDEEENSGCKN